VLKEIYESALFLELFGCSFLVGPKKRHKVNDIVILQPYVIQ